MPYQKSHPHKPESMHISRGIPVFAQSGSLPAVTFAKKKKNLKLIYHFKVSY